jgi:DNA-binding CsgD family transcriptional regulator
MLKPVRNADTSERAEPGVIRLDTLPDIVRKLRRMTDDIGASRFSVCFVAPRAEQRRIIPCLDTDYPGTAEETKLLAAMLDDRFAKRLTTSLVPLWWSKTEAPVLAEFPDQLYLAERIDPPAGPRAGVALPLTVEHGPEGVMFFTGDSISVSMDALCDLHARCIGLFSTIARLKPVTGSDIPSISRRELECLMLTANGLTSEEIAAKLGLSVHTANQYLTNTTRKLNAVNRMQAVAKALRMGLFE